MYDATAKSYGAHDLAPLTKPGEPFAQWENYGKSAKGLTIKDDLTNLDTLLREILQQEKLK
jgi:hypothetical protein